MSLFANLMAVTRLDNVDISDIVSQAVKGEYWTSLSHYLVDRFASVNATWYCLYVYKYFATEKFAVSKQQLQYLSDLFESLVELILMLRFYFLTIVFMLDDPTS